MKGDKKLLIIAVLLLLIAVSYGTYAIYRSSATSSDSIRAAKWVVEANDTDIVANNTFTLGNLDCGNNSIGKNGTIAPGDTCTATIVIDADGSEVDVNYTVSIDTSALTTLGNSQISVAAHSGSSLTDTISYSATEGDMEATVVLDVTWNALDTSAQNTVDVNTALAELEIPVTVSVVQNPTGLNP